MARESMMEVKEVMGDDMETLRWESTSGDKQRVDDDDGACQLVTDGIAGAHEEVGAAVINEITKEQPRCRQRRFRVQPAARPRRCRVHLPPRPRP